MMHTSEPWKIFDHPDDDCNVQGIAGEEDNSFCGAPIVCYNNKANARRIVACVNACADIENPEDLRRQRDELKAELENIANAKPSEWEELSNQFQEWAQSRARFTLAKIKGE